LTRLAGFLLLAGACGGARSHEERPAVALDAAPPPRIIPDAAPPDAQPAPRKPVRAQSIEIKGAQLEETGPNEQAWCSDKGAIQIVRNLPSKLAAVRAETNSDHTRASLKNAGGGTVVATGELPLEHLGPGDPIATVELANPDGRTCLKSLELDAPEGPLDLHMVPADALAAVDRDLEQIRAAVDACTPKALDPWLRYPVGTTHTDFKTAKAFAQDGCEMARRELNANPDLQRHELGRDRIQLEASWRCVAGTAGCSQDFELVWDGKHWKLDYLGEMGGGD
jgi:hypothetical protein